MGRWGLAVFWLSMVVLYLYHIYYSRFKIVAASCPINEQTIHNNVAWTLRKIRLTTKKIEGRSYVNINPLLGYYQPKTIREKLRSGLVGQAPTWIFWFFCVVFLSMLKGGWAGGIWPIRVFRKDPLTR